MTIDVRLDLQDCQYWEVHRPDFNRRSTSCNSMSLFEGVMLTWAAKARVFSAFAVALHLRKAAARWCHSDRQGDVAADLPLVSDRGEFRGHCWADRKLCVGPQWLHLMYRKNNGKSAVCQT